MRQILPSYSLVVIFYLMTAFQFFGIMKEKIYSLLAACRSFQIDIAEKTCNRSDRKMVLFFPPSLSYR